MGAGTNEASSGPAGHVPASAVRPYDAKRSAAAFVDLATGGFELAEAGQLRGTHPVDQAAVLSLLPLGALTGVPEVGIDFGRIRRASSRTVQAVVRAAVEQALRPLIEAEDIGSLKVSSLPGQSGITWVVEYENLRLPSEDRPSTTQEVRLLPRR